MIFFIDPTDYPHELAYINLNKPFHFNINSSGFEIYSSVDSSTSRPAILFGSLLGDDYSWVQFGGMLDIVSSPEGTKRVKDDSEKFDVRKDPENPGKWPGDFRFASTVALPGDVNNWVYAGAVASAPGDKKSWWLGGVKVGFCFYLYSVLWGGRRDSQECIHIYIFM